MDINELLDLVKEPIKEDQELDAQKLNACIDVLYALEEIALDEDDMECAQFLKDARIYVENYRKDRILDMTDDNGEAL